MLSDRLGSCVRGLTLRSQCTFWCSVLSDLVSETMASMTNGASQCTFWCSVLSDSRDRGNRNLRRRRSQCTFWCSVLSDSQQKALRAAELCLNAPSGAQCFPTPPPENRATTPFTGTKSPPTWKAPHRIGPHLSNLTTQPRKTATKRPSAADAPYPLVRHRLSTNPSQKTDPSQLRQSELRLIGRLESLAAK